MDELPPDKRRNILDSRRRSNAQSPEINRRIDALFATTAYKLYYMKFHNMSPDKHRDIFYGLPYEAIPGPAGISSNLKELCHNREAVRVWIRTVVGRIDPEHCRQVASKWLPPSTYTIPDTYFIYDGNGDAFAKFGSVVFDLFGLVMLQRHPDTRFNKLEQAGKNTIERVLSHEYHHVFSERYLYPSGRSFATWQARRKDAIIRSIVNEGVAMRCDGRREMQRAVMEDTATVVFWIDELEKIFTALDDGSMDETSFQAWFRDSFHDTAVARLRDYLSRAYGANELDALLEEHIVSRPSMIYTLGWWMVSRIAAAPEGRDVVISLLSNPHRIFEEYNATVSANPDELSFNLSLP
jgi:hypothetical protein